MSSIEQLDLYDGEQHCTAPSLHVAAFDSATHHRLDDHSWITHIRGLVDGDLTLMQQLATLSGWEQRSRWMYHRTVMEPRLTNEMPDLSSAPTFLIILAAALTEYCDVHYDAIWMNWYRDHQDSTSWHADRPANRPETAVVPVVSLGATRRFLIRPADGGSSIAFTPAGGDVIIMRGRCQRDWQHCVPKQRTPVGGRMSLNFNSRAQVC